MVDEGLGWNMLREGMKYISSRVGGLSDGILEEHKEVLSSIWWGWEIPLEV